jgi:hypothetical protein
LDGCRNGDSFRNQAASAALTGLAMTCHSPGASWQVPTGRWVAPPRTSGAPGPWFGSDGSGAFRIVSQNSGQERMNVTIRTREIYHSTNGDRWLLALDSDTDRVFVRHEPNLPSGGQVADIELGAFLIEWPRTSIVLTGRTIETKISRAAARSATLDCEKFSPREIDRMATLE